MRITRSVTHCAILVALATSLGFGQAPEPNEGKEYPDPERFEKAIRAFEEGDRSQPPPRDAIICIGSSSMKGWHESIREDLAPLTVVPRGFGGSNMNDALHFAGRIVIPYRPRAVVVYEGDNDVAHGIAPQKIRDTFRAFVARLHAELPKTRVYFLSIKPSIARWKLWPQMKEANRLIHEDCSKDPRLTLVDVAAGMLDAEGQVRPDIFKSDKLHMNRKGYVIWRDVLRPVLLEAELGFEAKAEEARFDPVVKSIEGWTVHVDPKLLEGEDCQEGARALQMLANHLQRIALLVPEDRLEKMRELEIWIEHRHPTLGAMQYHPNPGWLRSRGHDLRLAKKVHITQAKSLLSRHQLIKHPAVVLHELAHAYHDQHLSFDDPRIIEAYEKAKEAGTYEKVLLYTGKKVRHYAMSDHKEYFAEGTEAYFYRNDFYPFVRAELKEHDPTLHDLLVEIWGRLE
ncbi:MAG: GDSL-type esterase/lipase family protein [Planctomycetota bacterium]